MEKLTDDTIMPDGRPLFAWQNELEILRNEHKDIEVAKKELVIFKVTAGLIYESWQDNNNLDWCFRMKAVDAASSLTFYDALREYLHLVEKPTPLD